jgi:hypothetical protein
MRRTLARLALVALGLGLTVLGIEPIADAAAAPAVAAPAAVVAPAVVNAPSGGMTLSEYCTALGYQGAEVSDNGQSNPWVCYYGGGAYWTPLDLFGACRWQFRDLAAAGFGITYVRPPHMPSSSSIVRTSPSPPVMTNSGMCLVIGSCRDSLPWSRAISTAQAMKLLVIDAIGKTTSASGTRSCSSTAPKPAVCDSPFWSVTP